MKQKSFMPKIYQRKDGYWRCAWQATLPDGTTKRMYVVAKTEELAAKKYHEKDDKIRRPSQAILAKLAELYNVSIDDLKGETAVPAFVDEMIKSRDGMVFLTEAYDKYTEYKKKYLTYTEK